MSPEAAMAAEEQGLRYGPSNEILLTYEKENGSQVLVGRWEKGLSVVGVEPKWGIFWKSTDLIMVICIVCSWRNLWRRF